MPFSLWTLQMIFCCLATQTLRLISHSARIMMMSELDGKVCPSHALHRVGGFIFTPAQHSPLAHELILTACVVVVARFLVDPLH